eukprot:181393-Pleurochrysis_carterae.AAC.1
MPELTWQSIIDELRSLRTDSGLDPTLRLTALKAGAIVADQKGSPSSTLRHRRECTSIERQPCSYYSRD